MRPIHPFQKHFCVLFLSIALLATFATLKKRHGPPSETRPVNYTNDFLAYTSSNTSITQKYFGIGKDLFKLNSSSDMDVLDDHRVVYILGLFELTTKWGRRFEGESEMSAAKLAVDHVNALNVLSGYSLELLVNDTECDPGVGIDRFFHALYSKKTILMLLGAGCSNVSERLAHVVPYWNIIQVSFGSTSPSLSDRNKFPLFFRTVAPDTSHNSAKIHFVKEFGWEVVATFSQSENEYLLPVNHLVTELEKVNVSCISTVTFSLDNYKEQLRVLKDLEIRVIFGSFSSTIAPKIFCAVYEMDMYGEYVWILQNREEMWWNYTNECSIYEMRKAVEGIIMISDFSSISEDEYSISGLVNVDFEDALNVSKSHISKYAKQTYDAVWTIALALRDTQIYYWFDPITEYRYTRKDLACRWMDRINKLSFIGLSMAAWLSFKWVNENFLENHKSQNYRKEVAQMVENYRLFCFINQKLNFVDFHIDYFSQNLDAFSKKQTERFHQDLKKTRQRYQGRWGKYMLGDYCWMLARDILERRRKHNLYRFFEYRATVDVALFDSMKNVLDFNCKTCHSIRWKDDRLPIAQRILKISLIKIPAMLFYCVVLISSIGIGASFLFLYFNLHFRRMKSVKLSSPKLNNVAVFGCILVYSSVILLGFHNSSIKSEGHFSELCSVRVYLLSAGFSLAFGSMFAKTYRVHRLFTYLGAGLVKDKLLKDKQLIGLILIPLITDALILALWVAIDPMQRQLYNLTLEISSTHRGVVYQPQVEICSSHNTVGWYVALFGYKSIILVMGVFMAWKTRHVKVPALNDSQYIGICVYSAVFSTIVVILSSFLSNYFIIAYLAKTASILIATTITLFLLFLPKLKVVLRKIDCEDPIMHSMGLKIESNTRRFIFDDPREQICRLEIQNKVYRCELASLDKEISRLEELLAVHSSCSTKSSVNVIDTTADSYYLRVPTPIIGRGSWPSTHCELKHCRKGFLSDNKLDSHNSFDKTKIFERLKKFFGSFNSLHVTHQQPGVYQDYDLFRIRKHERIKPRSSPEIYKQVDQFKSLPKAKSDVCIKGNELFS